VTFASVQVSKSTSRIAGFCGDGSALAAAKLEAEGAGVPFVFVLHALEAKNPRRRQLRSFMGAIYGATARG
jgi:hypothetical protein